jgi:hypothetical protein
MTDFSATPPAAIIGRCLSIVLPELILVPDGYVAQ